MTEDKFDDIKTKVENISSNSGIKANKLFINKAMLNKEDFKMFGKFSNKNEQKYVILYQKYKNLKCLYKSIIKPEIGK